MTKKIDLRKQLKAFYSSPKKPNIIDVPPAKFLTITGRGEPGGEAYRAAMNALYSVAYTIKFRAKAAGKDFTVMTLEGLWWFDDPNASFDSVPREEWNWKSMIRQPDLITAEMVKEAKTQAKAKKGLEEIDSVVLEKFHEGMSAQIMHIGPYSEEGETIAELHRFIEENGYKMRGHHHEIYMSDPRRTAPERCKTIIRQPIEKA
ncbi:MAG: GyrI-like domain-containing protein [Aigarchaeota archaeon]|nr:GyrI-like domain-containing protein [Aigarchaeota archaeon]